MRINKFTLLTIFSVIYVITLIIIYYSKERIKTKETRVYKVILFSNLFGLICQFLCGVVSNHYDKMNSLLADFILKNYVFYFIIFGALMLVYIFAISDKNSEKYSKFIIAIYCVLGLVIYFLPISLNVDLEKDIMYSYGAAVNYSYVVGGITSILLIVMLIKEMKLVSRKKLLPLLLYLIFSGIAILIQKLNPEFMLICYVESFLCFVMYFTIENPDIKMLNEMYKNKELMEQNYEDKYNFLFEMTQEARNPLVNINNAYNEIRNEDNPKKIKEGLMAISNLVKQLDFSINNVLNISSLDVQKIKVVNSKYDLEKLCSELELKVKNELLKKDVEFNLSLPKQMPILYGDYMKIRQILYSLLINACKNTEKGSITLKINLIEKYDVCRIIFNISDTGRGMPIEKVNEIISATGELEKDEIDNLEKKEYNVKVCQKVVKIMGGNLMIKSNIGEGTEVNLTIDQRVYHEKDKSVLAQYEEEIANYRKVLIVSQNKEVINIIKKKFSANHITSSVLYYGMDAIDKIKSGKKYDFILIEDEMKEMTGFMTLKGMKEINGFDTPSIIMLKEDKEHIKDHFIEDGFSDAIIMDNLDNELDRIIEKY